MLRVGYNLDSTIIAALTTNQVSTAYSFILKNNSTILYHIRITFSKVSYQFKLCQQLPCGAVAVLTGLSSCKVITILKRHKVFFSSSWDFQLINL